MKLVINTLLALVEHLGQLSHDLFAWIDTWAPKLTVLLSTAADLGGKLLTLVLEGTVPGLV